MMPPTASSPKAPSLPVTTAVSSSSASDPTPFRQFVARLSDTARASLSNRRPWAELVDRQSLSKPDSLSDATSRLRKNLSYFRVNYFIVVASVVALSLLTNPFSLLLLLALFAAWSLLYLFRPSDPPLVLFGRTFNDRETLAGLVLLSVLVVFLTSVGSIIMSAAAIGALLVGAHGALRQPEDLFLDEQEASSGPAAGLLSFLGGVTGPSVAAVPPPGPAVVPPRV